MMKINNSIVWMLLVFVPVIVQGENITTSNEVRHVCDITMESNAVIRNRYVQNGGVTNSVTNDSDECQQAHATQESFRCGTKRLLLCITSIASLLVVLIDCCSKHWLWRLLMWMFNFFWKRIRNESYQHNASQKVGNQKIEIGNIVCGNNAKVNIDIAQSPKQHNREADKSGSSMDNGAHEPSAELQSGQKSQWNEIEKKYNPYRMIKVKATIKRIIEENLSTTDVLRARCPKKNIPICVIDDKDNEKYREGLKTLGYENVTIYSKCPAYEDLKPFAVVVFDVKGVGNAAGKDGFSLAVNFKAEYPLRVVGVRSAYLQGVSEEDKAKLDFAIEKNRDLCEQVAPILNDALKEVGSPVALWKKVREELMENSSAKEIALIEHEYVQAIRLLSQESDVLPGEWMIGVNRLLKRNIF